MFQAVKDQIARTDGILFVTPEQNRSYPALLKNALDAASRPWGKSVWGGKPAAVIGTFVGAKLTRIMPDGPFFLLVQLTLFGLSIKLIADWIVLYFFG